MGYVDGGGLTARERAELDRRAAAAKLDKGMARVQVYADDLGGDVAFVGKELAYADSRGSRLTVYLTAKHRIALYDHDVQRLIQYDTYEDFAEDMVGRPEVTMLVAQQLGVKHVVELDI
jgi:hypothetical protein